MVDEILDPVESIARLPHVISQRRVNPLQRLDDGALARSVSSYDSVERVQMYWLGHLCTPSLRTDPI